MAWEVERAYRDHLTAADLAILNEVAGGRPLVEVLSSPDLERTVFGGDPRRDPTQLPSPFLTFAVAIHRLAAQLDTAAYVNEWIGPRRRVPVFAVEPLRRLLADPLRRFFFVELLASYTHVASGSTWVATRRGWRRRRFSELDPVQLAGLLETVAAGGTDRRAAPPRRPLVVPDRRVPRSHRRDAARPADGGGAAAAHRRAEP